MYKSHFYTLDRQGLNNVSNLLTNKIDNQYFIVNDYGESVDIAQYSETFNNIKFITCKKDNLDKSMNLLDKVL